MVGFIALVVLVTGCGTETEQAGQTASTSPTTSVSIVTSFEGMVSLKNFSTLCSEQKCWLPTQFEPKLVEGETVSLRDQWPMDGMKVEVVCQTIGQTYRDQTGQSRDDWYGINVPVDKLEPLKPGSSPKTLPKSDGRIGYVGAAWIQGGAGKQATAC